MESSEVQPERCEVCVVGAGLTGLNALFAASRYLGRDQKVVLIDRRQRVGGMWVDTYPYVRLHQPYGMFTVGNIKWTLGADRSHLATKGEVLDHLERCLELIKAKVPLTTYFGYEYRSHEELPGKVRITARSADGRQIVVEAKRLIKAAGFQVSPNDPLEVSSNRVNSVSPDYCDVRGDVMRNGDSPVWVIGGGKTGMDTAHAVITEYPGREVNLVAGRGTYFTDRDRVFPTGIRRWCGGTRLNAVVAEIANRFDGTNEAEMRDWYWDTYAVRPTSTSDLFKFGILSVPEAHTITRGLNHVVMDYLEDVVDRNGIPELLFRGGTTRPTPPNSWIVNCSGYVFRDDHPYEPYVSNAGAVLSLQATSAILFLQSLQAYLLTHLMFEDKIRDVPLYELDAEELSRVAPEVLPFAACAMTQYNVSVLFDLLPSKVFRDSGLDYDRWFPLPRRLVATAHFMRNHRHERDHHRRTLDTVRERFSVRCGPLESV
jgi:hypothetical protein